MTDPKPIKFLRWLINTDNSLFITGFFRACCAITADGMDLILPDNPGRPNTLSVKLGEFILIDERDLPYRVCDRVQFERDYVLLAAPDKHGRGVCRPRTKQTVIFMGEEKEIENLRAEMCTYKSMVLSYQECLIKMGYTAEAAETGEIRQTPQEFLLEQHEMANYVAMSNEEKRERIQELEKLVETQAKGLKAFEGEIARLSKVHAEKADTSKLEALIKEFEEAVERYQKKIVDQNFIIGNQETTFAGYRREIGDLKAEKVAINKRWQEMYDEVVAVKESLDQRLGNQAATISDQNSQLQDARATIRKLRSILHDLMGTHAVRAVLEMTASGKTLTNRAMESLNA